MDGTVEWDSWAIKWEMAYLVIKLYHSIVNGW